MATNGWYVEKIITDLQSGKVDEFIKKEGKWFNYLKGEATTFTNAADAGSASGNVDFEEFSVQGIGTISGTPFVSGTTPAIGGNIVVNVSGGVDWTSTGFSSYNIATLPSTGTFTILPDDGNVIAASQFSELVLELPSYVTSITFADTDTAYSNSNTVVGTINFDGSSLSSGTTTTYNLLLSPEAVSSGILWEGTVTVYGSFFVGESGWETISAAEYAYATSSAEVSTSYGYAVSTQTYIVSAVIVPELSNMLVHLDFQAFGGKRYYEDTPATVTIDVPSSELSQYAIETSDPNMFERGVKILYNPELGTDLDDNNNITIYTNAANGTCKFFPVGGDSLSALSFDSVTMSPFGFNDPIGVLNDLGGFTVSVSYPDGTTPWITLGDIYVSDELEGSYVYISAGENDTGISRTATLKLTSFTNETPSPNDTLEVTQEISDSVDISGQFRVPNPEYVGGWGVDPATAWIMVGYTNGDGGGDWTQEGFLGTTTSEGTNYKLAWDHGSDGLWLKVNCAFNDPASDLWGLSADGWTVQDLNTDDLSYPDWIEQAGGSTITAGQIITPWSITSNFEGVFEEGVLVQSERHARFTYTHPDDPSVTDTFEIKQALSYDPNSNTFVFKTISGSLGAGTATFSEENANNTFVVSDQAQTVELYGFTGTPVPLGTFLEDLYPGENAASVNATGFPLPWYQNLGLGDGTATIMMIEGDEVEELGPAETAEPWISDLECHYAPDIINGGGASATLVTDVNQEIEFFIPENFAVRGTAPFNADFPVPRTFTLQGFSPYNTTADPNDTIIIKQEQKPWVDFVQSSGALVDGTLSETTLNVHTTKTNAPSVWILTPEEDVVNPADGTIVTNPPQLSGSNGWITIDSVTDTGVNHAYEGETVGKTFKYKLNLEPNWNTSTRSAYIVAYHYDTVGNGHQPFDPGAFSSDPFDPSPNQFWGPDKVISFGQTPTPALLEVNEDPALMVVDEDVDVNGNSMMVLRGSAGFPYGAAGLQLQFPSVTLPILYNGATPTISDVFYSPASGDGVSSSTSTLTNCPWITSAEITGIDGGWWDLFNYGLVINFNHTAQLPGTTKAVSFKITHENGTLYSDITLIFTT